EVVPQTLRNPLFHWTHMELKNPFGVKEYLNKENGKRVYKHCNDLLQTPDFSAQGLLKHFNVTTVCTTDDPCDHLEHHDRISSGTAPSVVRPAFRPDSVLKINTGDTFRSYIKRLSEASNIEIKNYASLIEALVNRISYFHSKGARLADHGLDYIPIFNSNGQKEAEQTLQKVLNGDDNLLLKEIENYTGLILYELCKSYNKFGWVQQFHLGALRTVNNGKLGKFGPDTGFDSIGDYRQAPGLAHILDLLEQNNALTKTILYNLNP